MTGESMHSIFGGVGDRRGLFFMCRELLSQRFKECSETLVSGDEHEIDAAGRPAPMTETESAGIVAGAWGWGPSSGEPGRRMPPSDRGTDAWTDADAEGMSLPLRPSMYLLLNREGERCADSAESSVAGPGIRPQRMSRALSLQVATVPAQVSHESAALHSTTTVSRSAPAGTPRRPSSRRSFRINAMASRRLRRASLLVRPCPLAPGISGQ